MSQVKILLMDDIHIEGRSSEQILNFQNIVKEKIKIIKENNDIPIVVLAGDIGEGTEGLKWMKPFDCDIVYVCGNHEFWNRDYFQTYTKIISELEKPEYSHIHFINQTSFELHGVRFLGATMWTNLGYHLKWYDNKNLAVKYFPIMGDFKKITIKGWYTNENIKRLRSFMAENITNTTPFIEDNINALIDNEYFNPLFELDEHKKAVEYIKKELEKDFDGITVVVTHHLPDSNLWSKAKNMNPRVLQGEYLNNDRLLFEGAKGKNKMYRDAMLIGYYANDLTDLMYQKNAPNYWFHGHLHIPVLNTTGRTNIISSPVGYHTQSSEISMKEFYISHQNTFIAETIKKNILDYNWDEILKLLLDYEALIKVFEPLIQSNFVTASEFKIIAQQFRVTHQNNIDQLKLDISKWLAPIIYKQEAELIDKQLDYFKVVLKSGILKTKLSQINGEDIKFKIPEYILTDINITDTDEENRSCKSLKTEIHKIILQIKNLRKLMLEFTNELARLDGDKINDSLLGLDLNDIFSKEKEDSDEKINE